MDLVAILKDFGFPVACVVALGMFVRWLITTNRQDMKEMLSAHANERKDLVVKIEDAVKQAGVAYQEQKTEYKAHAERAVEAQKELAISNTKMAEGLRAVASGQDEMAKTLYRVKCAYGSGPNPTVDSKH